MKPPIFRRIAIVTHEFLPFRGGIGRVAEGLAQGALEAGWEPVVIAPDYGAESADDDRRLDYPVRRFHGAHCSMVSPRRLVRFARHLRGELPPLAPDLVHAVCPASQMALTALSRFRALPAPLGLTIHGTELLRYRGELLPRAWMFRGFHRAVGIASVSRAVQRLLHDHFPVPRERSFVSHPGIGTEWHERPPTDAAATRERWGAGEDDFVILTVARRVPEKGHDRVIAGIAALPAGERERMLYVVAGSGPGAYARQLEDAAARAGVRLRLLDAVTDDEIVEGCDAADLFAMLSRETPTRLEGFGLAYLEAGRRGCPAIACRTGGVAEAVSDGETGLLLAPGPDPDDVAAAIRRFSTDRGFRERTGEAARRRAARFTHARYAADVYGRFAGLAGGRPPGG